MRIAIWTTNHHIADTVAEHINRGLRLCCQTPTILSTTKAALADQFDLSIGYGILRGMTAVFRASKNYIHLDRGFWKSGHFSGYYRVSHNGTQQTRLANIPTDPSRWNNLDIEIQPKRLTAGLDKILVCPPTPDVCNFFNLDVNKWLNHTAIQYKDKVIIRHKDSSIPLAEHLAQARKVVTFNSSVGWEAMRQGIEVVSDPSHSIIGAWKKELDKDATLDLDERCKIFAKMAALQLTLEEMQQGSLWSLMSNLMSMSGGIVERL